MCGSQALQPSPCGPATVPPSPNKYGRQQDCRLKCPIGFPLQARMHRHEVLCQRPTSQPELAYAQEAPTFAIHSNTNRMWPKKQFTPDKDTLAPLLPDCIKCMQTIIGPLLYYACAVDNKLLVALNAISARQAKAKINMEQLVETFLNYVSTYPNDGIAYRACDVVLCAHADAGYLNKTWLCSRAGAHIFLSKDDPSPHFNGTVLTIAIITKFVMASAAKAELAALFIAAREMIPHRQTLIDMGWLQPWSPIQTDNSTAVGVTTKTIVPKQSKMMDMRLWWLRCWGLQKSISILLGCKLKELGWLQHQTPPQYTLKPIAPHIQVYGTSLGFSLNENTHFYIFFSNFTSIWGLTSSDYHCKGV
jgi:hypothetical protein